MYRISFIYSYYGLDMAHFEEDFQKGDHCLNNMRMYYIDRSRNRKGAKQSAIFVARKSHSSYRTLLALASRSSKSATSPTRSWKQSNPPCKQVRFLRRYSQSYPQFDHFGRTWSPATGDRRRDEPPLIYVVWSADGSLVALMSKHSQSNCLVFQPFSYFL